MDSDNTSSATPRWRVTVIGVTAGFAVLGLLVYGAVIGVAATARQPECEAVNGARSQGVIFTSPAAAKKDPMLFCSCLSEAARRTSSNWLLAALMIGGLGAVCTLFGGALGPEPGAEPGTFKSQRGILLTGMGALLISLAVYSNSRATVASSVAADAHSALALAEPEQMFVACIRAKSDWIASRSESAALIFDQLATPAKRKEKVAPLTPTHTD